MSQHSYTSYTPDITVCAAGREWQLSRAGSLDSLWENMVAEGRADADEHIPYWTELWPASLVLADWLVQCREQIAGRYCLDLGCGIGLTALAGASLGARVLGMDYEEQALHFAARNAARNAVPGPLWVTMDWSRPALARGCMDFVWGGDIMYERRFVEPVLAFCRHVLRPGGRFWVAEPGRTVYDAFLAALPASGWSGRPVYTGSTRGIYEQPQAVTVTIWEITDRGSSDAGREE